MTSAWTNIPTSTFHFHRPAALLLASAGCGLFQLRFYVPPLLRFVPNAFIVALTISAISDPLWPLLKEVGERAAD